MKSPLCGYYGGKGRLAPDIAAMIDRQEWTGYVEPFCGGASVYFAINKGDPKRGYTLNDYNGKIVNFYSVIKTRPDDIMKIIDDRFIFSKQWHQHAREIWDKDIEDEVEHAWSLWYMVTASFGSILGGTFSRQPGDMSKQILRMHRGKKRMVDAIGQLELATIDCMDANELVAKYDRAANIFYIDPPYVDANQSHYSGYTQESFDELLHILGNMKGKFILSHYQNDNMEACIDKYSWHVKRIATHTAASNQGNTYREEWLVYNFVDGVKLL